MFKSSCLGMLMLDISKTLMYEFLYVYVKPVYKGNAKLCYMGTYYFITHIKAKNFYGNCKVFEDVDRPLPMAMNR